MKEIKMFMCGIMVLTTLSACKNPENSKQKENAVVTQQKTEEKSHVHADDPAYVTKEIKVTGNVITPLALTVDSLKKMDVKDLKDFNIICQSGLTKDKIESTKGVLLKDILNKAKIEQKDHTDRNFYIVARAADDYKATFSWAEIFNNPNGEQTYILFEQNGQPLKDKGEMIVVSMNDTKTGPRHVKWLKSIEVHRVE
ncbi:molybdopterin-dependent oxidoreductase [Chryseobacterium sp. CT-SW4]|uniref:molybdopterin-dependent oxidoreductase n=1 Tax=Chryseobacterium sp. SW-1 TaxID=3157343 RepID=UPI003B01AFE6